MISQVLHVSPEEQDRMTVERFEDACNYLEDTGVVKTGG